MASAFDRTSIAPPCICRMRYVIASPIPLPFGFVVKYSSKIRGNPSAGIPSPSSATSTTANWWSRRSFTRIDPPSGIACIPFSSRFSRACRICSASTRTISGSDGASTMVRTPCSCISAAVNSITTPTTCRRSCSRSFNSIGREKSASVCTTRSSLCISLARMSTCR